MNSSVFDERSIQIEIESHSTTSTAAGTTTATTEKAEETMQQPFLLYIIIVVSVVGAILAITLIAILCKLWKRCYGKSSKTTNGDYELILPPIKRIANKLQTFRHGLH